MKKLFIITILFFLAVACNRHPSPTQPTNPKPAKTVTVPVFNADSAYAYVKAQTDFGPRVPGTEAHASCAQWLVDKLAEYADTVMVQEFRTRLYTGKGMDGKNLIASFNPDAKKRIVLCAHWDSRPFADHDSDEANWNHPIDGANDGASGVGVLLEMARGFKQQPLNEKLGVDLIFFDLEDYGPRQDLAEQYYDDRRNYWALGSQYWAAQPHLPGYTANFGILLDMVGGSDPSFQKEYYSQGYAAWVSNKVWRMAQNLGYQEYFVNELGDPISDDHLPLNEVAGIPCIDLIDLKPESSNGSFPETWHTLNDNLEHIDKQTLEMVGNVLNHTVYQE
ncbi:MAG: M28 family peptidase [Bacteroidales bacterium]|nr:M28 family peptidase [Bacteroidales bacterium]